MRKRALKTGKRPLERRSTVAALRSTIAELHRLMNTLKGEGVQLLAEAVTQGRTIRVLNEKVEVLEQRVITDPLTGLLNRHGEELVIHPAIHAVQRRRKDEESFNVTLVAIDLDHFKRINDTHGHSVGDQVLKLVSELIRVVFRRDVDHILRFGGEEFFVVAISTTPREAADLAEKLRINIADDPRLNLMKTGQVTASFGVAALDTENHDVGMAFKAAQEKADQALYGAKRAGRNIVMYP